MWARGWSTKGAGVRTWPRRAHETGRGAHPSPRRFADGVFPCAPATGRVAGIDSKSLRDAPRFCAVERLPRLSEACTFAGPLCADGAAVRLFAPAFAVFFSAVAARAFSAVAARALLVAAFFRASGFPAGACLAVDFADGPGGGGPGTSAPRRGPAGDGVMPRGSNRSRARLRACFCLWRSCRMSSP